MSSPEFVGGDNYAFQAKQAFKAIFKKAKRQRSWSIQQQQLVEHNGYLNTLRPGQNGRHFPDDHLKCIFLNENIWISIHISLKFAPKGRINNIPALVRIMAWRRLGDKPLSEPMMVGLLTHMCVTRPQWLKTFIHKQCNNNCNGNLLSILNV